MRINYYARVVILKQALNCFKVQEKACCNICKPNMLTME